jgi:hypothetical protein
MELVEVTPVNSLCVECGKRLELVEKLKRSNRLLSQLFRFVGAATLSTVQDGGTCRTVRDIYGARLSIPLPAGKSNSDLYPLRREGLAFSGRVFTTRVSSFSTLPRMPGKISKRTQIRP